MEGVLLLPPLILSLRDWPGAALKSGPQEENGPKQQGHLWGWKREEEERTPQEAGEGSLTPLCLAPLLARDKTVSVISWALSSGRHQLAQG